MFSFICLFGLLQQPCVAKLIDTHVTDKSRFPKNTGLQSCELDSIPLETFYRKNTKMLLHCVQLFQRPHYFNPTTLLERECVCLEAIPLNFLLKSNCIMVNGSNMLAARSFCDTFTTRRCNDLDHEDLCQLHPHCDGKFKHGEFKKCSKKSPSCKRMRTEARCSGHSHCFWRKGKCKLQQINFKYGRRLEAEVENAIFGEDVLRSIIEHPLSS